ncbi:hypothetical protein [Absidia glauca]|uniref:Uncharacterized protein n=1 Tax=Absidia glauca TaxID=4829 RepID=A0A163J4E7_ABSGL|nr:hypothetical protein [Absidia glauca]
MHPKDGRVERSAVLWHLQVCMVTFYTQALPKDDNKRKPYLSLQFTDSVDCAHQGLQAFTIAAPPRYFLHLTTIHLEGNQLTHLPENLWHLTGLVKLNLGGNQLTTLPPDLGRLIALEELYLHDNRLCSLPSQIGRLKRLKVLDVMRNPDLRTLPGELVHPSRSLWVDRNPCQPIPNVFPSLFHLCAQLAGPSLATTDNNNLPLYLFDSLTKADLASSPVAPLCSICHTVLYYPGIPLLELKGHRAPFTNYGPLALLYHVCSQTCRSQWLKDHPLVDKFP